MSMEKHRPVCRTRAGEDGAAKVKSRRQRPDYPSDRTHGLKAGWVREVGRRGQAPEAFGR